MSELTCAFCGADGTLRPISWEAHGDERLQQSFHGDAVMHGNARCKVLELAPLPCSTWLKREVILGGSCCQRAVRKTSSTSVSDRRLVWSYEAEVPP